MEVRSRGGAVRRLKKGGGEKEISSVAIDSQTYTNFANQTYKQMQTDTKQEILKNRLMEAVGKREGWGEEKIE